MTSSKYHQYDVLKDFYNNLKMHKFSKSLESRRYDLYEKRWRIMQSWVFQDGFVKHLCNKLFKETLLKFLLIIAC